MVLLVTIHLLTWPCLQGCFKDYRTSTQGAQMYHAKKYHALMT